MKSMCKTLQERKNIIQWSKKREKAEEKGFIPGFEATTLMVAMIGVCIILLRKRKELC